jgi:hypothetical protein
MGHSSFEDLKRKSIGDDSYNKDKRHNIFGVIFISIFENKEYYN